MEYLVTMTTRVPRGTSEETVQAMREREAGRSRELAARGHLLRLWRPPTQPGEWRSIGLFAADDATQLERVLASMPLHAWRSDEVSPLMPHPNNPSSTAPTSAAAEFLTTFTVTFPRDVAKQEVDVAERREAERTRELAEQGHLARLWMLPAEAGSWHALGLWRAEGAAEMQAIVESLPLTKWMTTETTPLTPHPNDPAAVPTA